MLLCLWCVVIYCYSCYIYKYRKRKKIDVSVRLADDHLFGKLLLTWLSLVMSLMVSFCAVPLATRCLG